MDVGPPPKIFAPPPRTTSAVGDGDVGQKGSYYRRRARENKSVETDQDPGAKDRPDESGGSIDIRV